MSNTNEVLKQKLIKQAFEKIHHIESLLMSVDVKLAEKQQKAA
ncbi:hypothetical protein [Vibrio parahaemolyticus]|nr:hypothetical protein [Vibrio parahaemolyticus]